MLKNNKTLFTVCVYLGPLFLLWAWLTFGYTHRYAAITQFILRNHQDSANAMLGSVVLSGSAGNQQDLHLVLEYILSPNLLEELDAELALRTSYSSSSVLPPQRLDPNASFQAFLAKYRSLIKASIDTTSGIITLEIEGYDADQVFRQYQATLKRAEDYINRVSKDVAVRQTASAREHLEIARQERAEKTSRLLTFQSENSTFMPSRDSASALSLIGGLESSLAAEKAHHAALSGMLASNAPSLLESQAKIEALEKQVAAERSRLVEQSPASSIAFNQLLSNFQVMQLDVELATKSYADALGALQRAQITASENLKALVIVASATRPESPSYPRIWVWMLVGVVVQLFVAPRIAERLTTIRRPKKKGRGNAK